MEKVLSTQVSAMLIAWSFEKEINTIQRSQEKILTDSLQFLQQKYTKSWPLIHLTNSTLKISFILI